MRLICELDVFFRFIAVFWWCVLYASASYMRKYTVYDLKAAIILWPSIVYHG